MIVHMPPLLLRLVWLLPLLWGCLGGVGTLQVLTGAPAVGLLMLLLGRGKARRRGEARGGGHEPLALVEDGLGMPPPRLNSSCTGTRGWGGRGLGRGRPPSGLLLCGRVVQASAGGGSICHSVAALTKGEGVCRGVSHDVGVHDQFLKATHVHVRVDGHVLGGAWLGGGRGVGKGGCSWLLWLLDWTQLPSHLWQGDIVLVKQSVAETYCVSRAMHK